MSHFYDEETKQQIIDLYQQGKDTVQISKLVDKSQSGIERLLKRLNLYQKVTHRKKIPHSETQKIIDLYLDGSTTIEIAKLYSCTDTNILHLLKRNNISTSNRADIYSPVKNLDYFENIDTETKAYLLGFITADGNVTIPSAKPNSMVFQLEIQERDREVLELLADEIALDRSHIHTYQRSRPIDRQSTCKISFSSKRFCTHLAKYGVVPRKCHKTYFPTLPKELERHYIRGLIDGDGSINQYVIELCGNKDFLLEVKQRWINEAEVHIDSIKEYMHSCYHICLFQKQERIKLFKYLYEDCIVKLNRKAVYSPF